MTWLVSNAELDRVRVVKDRRISNEVVQMGSAVRRASDDVRPGTLVFPGEADIDGVGISILTPIGAALLSLSVGQSIAWVRAMAGRTG